MDVKLLYGLLVTYVFMSSGRFIMTKLTDLYTIDGIDGVVHYRHPTF